MLLRRTKNRTRSISQIIRICSCIFLILVIVNFYILCIIKAPSKYNVKRNLLKSGKSEYQFKKVEIPKIIHQIYFSKSPPNHETLNKTSSWKIEQFEYIFYDYSKATAFLSEYFSPIVLETFENLKPFAYKADLLRYCVLYILGGIYADIDLELKRDLYSLIDLELNPDAVSMAIGRDKQTGKLLNGLMFSVPNNPYFLECIQRIIYNSEYHVYGKSSLDITGPGLIGSVVGLYQPGYYYDTHNMKIFIFDTFQSHHSFFLNTVVYGKLDGYPFPPDHYSSMWNIRDVYYDESIVSRIWNLCLYLLQKW